MDYSYAGRYARRLHVDLFTGPQAERADLEICKLADGSPWVLGSGACGVVYKVSNTSKRLRMQGVDCSWHVFCNGGLWQNIQRGLWHQMKAMTWQHASGLW